MLLKRLGHEDGNKSLRRKEAGELTPNNSNLKQGVDYVDYDIYYQKECNFDSVILASRIQRDERNTVKHKQ